jgi:hypothetical protein
MLNPLPVLYPSARWWMLRSFARMITSGLVAVEFRDFFLVRPSLLLTCAALTPLLLKGDEMNSLYYSVRFSLLLPCSAVLTSFPGREKQVYNLGFLYCTYNKGWPDDAMSVCSTNKTWTTAILSAVPAFIRLGQSVRRYLDSDGLYLHLLNACVLFFPSSPSARPMLTLFSVETAASTRCRALIFSPTTRGAFTNNETATMSPGASPSSSSSLPSTRSIPRPGVRFPFPFFPFSRY